MNRFPGPLTAHAAGLFLVFVLYLLERGAARLGLFPLALVKLPSTLLHESTHFVAGFVTGGRPGGFSLFPRSAPGRRVLGTVTLSRPGALSLLPTGLAPLTLFLLAWRLPSLWFHALGGSWKAVLVLYPLLFVVCAAGIPSRADLETAFSSTAGLFIYGGIAGGAAVILLGG